MNSREEEVQNPWDASSKIKERKTAILKQLSWAEIKIDNADEKVAANITNVNEDECTAKKLLNEKKEIECQRRSVNFDITSNLISSSSMEFSAVKQSLVASSIQLKNAAPRCSTRSPLGNKLKVRSSRYDNNAKRNSIDLGSLGRGRTLNRASSSKSANQRKTQALYMNSKFANVKEERSSLGQKLYNHVNDKLPRIGKHSENSSNQILRCQDIQSNNNSSVHHMKKLDLNDISDTIDNEEANGFSYQTESLLKRKKTLDNLMGYSKPVRKKSNLYRDLVVPTFMHETNDDKYENIESNAGIEILGNYRRESESCLKINLLPTVSSDDGLRMSEKKQLSKMLVRSQSVQYLDNQAKCSTDLLSRECQQKLLLVHSPNLKRRSISVERLNFEVE